jgi:DNA-binding SARP family transcriptional activator/tetratricopeptide (TPR) repeat protein
VVFALAFYLCVRAGERLTRDEVVEVFWGTADVTKGRHSLRQMLYKLRQRGFALDEDGEELYLDPDRLVSDVSDALLESWSDDASVASLESSLDLVPALTKGVSSRFHEWLDSLRARLGAQHRRAAIRHLHQARREGRWSDLDRIALLMLRTDPLNEEATLARAESAAMIGSKALALEILDQYVEELGDKATKIGLPATVLRRRISERGGAWHDSGPLSAPLVGRQHEIQAIVHLLERAATGQGGSAVLVGVGGAGKSRLVQEMCGIAQLNGFATVSVRTEASASARPLTTFLSLARELIRLEGAGGADPAAFALLRRLSELPTTTTEPSLASVPSLNHESISWAIVETLDAIAAEKKLLLCLDDLHKAHARSIDLLADLISATGSLRLVWLLAARPEEFAAQKLASATTTTLRVNSLDLGPAQDLARFFLGENDARPQASENTVVRLAGGNPFFIRETALHLRRNTSSRSVPASLVALMGQRLSKLNEIDHTVLRVARLLGSHATLGCVSRATARPLNELAFSIERLELEGIIKFSPQKRIELHDCWTAVLDQNWSAASKAALSLVCAEVLESEHSHSPVLEIARASSELYREAGDTESTTRLMEATANDAIAVGLYADSIGPLTYCVNQAPHAETRLRILARRAVAFHAAGDFENAQRDCELALQATGENTVQTRTARAIAFGVLTDSLWRLGKDNSKAMERLASVAEDPSIDPTVVHHVCLMAIRAVFSVRGSQYAEHFAKVAREESARSGSTVYGEQCALMFAAENGDVEGVLAADEKLELLSSVGLAPSIVLKALQNRASALRLVGKLEIARSRLDEAIRISEDLGLIEELGATHLKACYLALDLCDIDRAQACWDRAAALPYARQSEQNVREHRHALSRLRFQSADPEGSLAPYPDCIEAVESDNSDRRRAVISASLALPSAMTGRTRQAERLLHHCLDAIRRERPGRYMDFPAEFAARTLLALGKTVEAEQLLCDYATRRAGSHDGGPVPYLSALRTKLELHEQRRSPSVD